MNHRDGLRLAFQSIYLKGFAWTRNAFDTVIKGRGEEESRLNQEDEGTTVHSLYSDFLIDFKWTFKSELGMLCYVYLYSLMLSVMLI